MIADAAGAGDDHRRGLQRLHQHAATTCRCRTSRWRSSTSIKARMPTARASTTATPSSICSCRNDGTPDPETTRCNKLTNAEQVADAETARAGVDNGKYAAAIIIPADFSAKLTYSQTHPIEPVAGRGLRLARHADFGRASSAASPRASSTGSPPATSPSRRRLRR